MKKAAEAFRSIGEVAKLIGVAPHVLRYWETQFPQLKPMKRPDGRRYYRPEDVRLAAGLCEVLRDDGLTIRGARKLMARDRAESVRERGAARLAVVFDGPEHADTPGRAKTPSSPQDPARQDPTAPRMRQRRKRQAAEDTALPLFPDLPGRSTGALPWLTRLIALSALLGRPPQPCPPQFRSAAIRLHGAIEALNPHIRTN